MKKNSIYSILSLLIVAGAVVIYLVVNKKESSSASPQESTMQMANKPTYFELKAQPAHNKLTIPGEIMADKSADIYAKVLSYVKFIRVDIGAEVKQGDVLLELEAPELTAQLASLRSKINSLEVQVKLSNSSYERLVAASATDGAISPLALDESFTTMESNKALLAATQADYEQVKSMLDYLVIKAPFSGIITRRSIDVGSMVGPATQKEPLLVLQDNKQLRIQLAINERYATQIRQGDTLSFTIRSIPTQKFYATISRKSGAFDTRLRSETIEADIKNQEKLLVPGMVADATLRLHQPTSYVVPKQAITTTEQEQYVTLSTDDRVKVQTGKEKGDQIEIFGNLNVGDLLQLNQMK